MLRVKSSSNIILILAAALVLLLTAAACGLSSASSPTDTPAAPLNTPDPSFNHHVSAVTVPANFRDTYILYATVERVDGTVRDIYINPESASHLDTYGPLANDTTIAILGYNAERDAAGNLLRDDHGHFIRGTAFDMFHVIEKRSDWTPADFPGSDRSGMWNFGSFNSQTSQRYDESLSVCFQCHNVTGGTDFLYSRTLLAYFALTGAAQYAYCDLTGRAACAFR